MSKYVIHSVGEFYEVFNTETKETVYVSETKHLAQLAKVNLDKNGHLPLTLQKEVQ